MSYKMHKHIEFFVEGRAKRDLYPLPPNALYKLKEAEFCWQKRSGTISLLLDHIISNRRIPEMTDLGGWMGYEWQVQLSKLPGNISFDLGFRIYPAILSFVKTQTKNEHCRSNEDFRKQIDELIQLCDRSCPRIAKPTKSKNLTIKRLELTIILVSTLQNLISSGLEVGSNRQI